MRVGVLSPRQSTCSWGQSQACTQDRTAHVAAETSVVGFASSVSFAPQRSTAGHLGVWAETQARRAKWPAWIRHKSACISTLAAQYILGLLQCRPSELQLAQNREFDEISKQTRALAPSGAPKGPNFTGKSPGAAGECRAWSAVPGEPLSYRSPVVIVLNTHLSI